MLTYLLFWAVIILGRLSSNLLFFHHTPPPLQLVLHYWGYTFTSSSSTVARSWNLRSHTDLQQALLVPSYVVQRNDFHRFFPLPINFRQTNDPKYRTLHALIPRVHVQYITLEPKPPLPPNILFSCFSPTFSTGLCPFWIFSICLQQQCKKRYYSFFGRPSLLAVTIKRTRQSSKTTLLTAVNSLVYRLLTAKSFR